MPPEAGLVTESGAAHTQASQILSEIADQLVTHVQVLHQNWSGTAAQRAVGSFQQLHETAIGLARASAKDRRRADLDGRASCRSTRATRRRR